MLKILLVCAVFYCLGLSLTGTVILFVAIWALCVFLGWRYISIKYEDSKDDLYFRILHDRVLDEHNSLDRNLKHELNSRIKRDWNFIKNDEYKGLVNELHAVNDYKIFEYRIEEESKEHYFVFKPTPALYAGPTGQEFFTELERQKQLSNRFSVKLKEIIKIKGLENSFVYKKANIDRKLFSKIITNDDYVPNKRTVLALCIALELDIDDTLKLLQHAGYTLSDALLSDIIVKYFIEKKEYDLYTINNALFEYEQKLLGSLE